MESRPWADNLPPAAAWEIVRRLTCRADRGAMAAVCRAWRALATEGYRRPPPLPWLLLPTAESTRVHCVLSDFLLHHRIHDLPHGARYFGSHDDSWLFVAFDHSSDHEAFHLQGGRTHFLPDVVLQDGEYTRPMSILAAALSSPPPTCVVGGIGAYHQPDVGLQRRRRFAFCATDDVVAYEFAAPGDAGGADLEVEDVLYHERSRAFYFLTRGEHILVCTATLVSNQDQPPLLSAVLRRFLPGGRERDYEDPVRARYIVQSDSGEELMMVVRVAPHGAHTSSFKMFRAIPPSEMLRNDYNHEAGYLWSWGELDTLGPRMLFVGRGCSTSYAVADYPGLSQGIYFSDDRSFHDDEIMLRAVRERQYPCSDIGKWSEGPPPGIRFFFPEHGASRHSPPVWILPPRLLPELPTELQLKIVRKMRCDANLFRALRAFGPKAKDLIAPAQLPWLVLPSPGGFFLGCLICGGGGGGGAQVEVGIHPAGVPVHSSGAHLFGSFDGRWISLAQDDTKLHKVVNTFSGKVYSLPSLVTFGEGVFSQKILAATFSTSPEHRDCIAAGIVSYKHPTAKPMCTNRFGYKGQGSTQVSVWQMGDEVAVDPLSAANRKVYAEADDILFYNAELHCISGGEDLFVWTPTYLPNDNLKLHDLDNWRHFTVDYQLDKQRARSRYLVESRGQLLLVVKYGTCSDWASSETEGFRMFQLTVPKVDFYNNGPIECPFIEVPSLDGRMMFLGRGCSRCYEVAQYPGFRDSIFFLDDRCGSDDGSDVKEYPCKENGKWTEGQGVEYCYPEKPSSISSPPAWLLP